MTYEKVEELKKIQEEMEFYNDAIKVFDIDYYEQPSYQPGSRSELIHELRKPFRFILRCFKYEGRDCVELKPKGFGSSKALHVDMEFVEMCHEYFEKKLAEAQKRFEEL